MISLLFIDAELDLLAVGKRILEKNEDFIVDTISSPIEALKKVKKSRYDAIISDYEMSGMNGIDFLKEVRKQDDDVPFLFFTAKGREDVVIEALNNGADFYLQKSDKPQLQFVELEEQIRKSIAKRKAKQSLVESVDKLQAASSRYEALIAASNTGGWEYNRETGKLWCSPEHFSMLGYDIREYGESSLHYSIQVWSDLIHPEDRDRAITNWNLHLTHPEKLYEQYFRMQHRDGRWIWILSRGKALRDPSGNISNLTVGTHIDVTDQKLAEGELLRKNEELHAAYEEIIATEEELRSNNQKLISSTRALEISEQRYSLTLESINDGLWDLHISTGDLFFSPQFYRMCGYEPDGFPSDITYWISQIHPGDREKVQSLFNRTLMDGEDFGVEYRSLRRDGTYFWIHSRGKVVEFTPEGLPLRIVGTHTDITARKNIEEDLEENRRTLQTLMDNLPGMVYRCENNIDWTMDVVSDGVFALTGYQREEMLRNRDVSYGSIIHPDDQEKVWQFVEEGVIRNQPYQLTYRIICKDGSVKWVWEQGRGIFHGEVLWALEGYITDVTSEIMTQKALQKMAHSIEHLKEGVFWFNDEGIIFDMNISFLEVISEFKESVIGSSVTTLPLILQSRIWSELMLQAKSTGSVTEDTLLSLSPETHKNLRMRISYGTFGEETVFCGIINDRTQEEAYLHEVVRSKEELASAFEELILSEENLKVQYHHLVETKDALQKSEEKYRSIFEDAILGIFQVTKEGSILEVNPAFSRIYGFESPDEMRSIMTDIRNQMYVHPEDRDRLIKILDEFGEVRGFESEEYRKDGSTIWISMNEKVVRDENGEVRFLEGTIDDITRRKIAESENEIVLHQIRKNFAEFAILNDGIRNPLTVIAILAESCGSPLSEQILDQIHRIDDLINQLDNRWMESDKVIRYLQKHHNY